MVDHIVVGGGHNGLVTACYLARAGLDVLVLEQSAKLGGGSRTDELLPGYRFNTHSAAHNIINSTGIVEELGLGAVGLEYREMDPFSVAVHRDGAIVRFYRSVEQTVASIREVAPDDADRYRVWMADTMPIVTAMRAGLEAGTGTGQWPVTAHHAGNGPVHHRVRHRSRGRCRGFPRSSGRQGGPDLAPPQKSVAAGNTMLASPHGAGGSAVATRHVILCVTMVKYVTDHHGSPLRVR